MGIIVEELRPAPPEALREWRKDALRRWLDSDPALREGFIAMNDELTKLARHVAKLERLAVGFRTDLIPDHCP